MLASASAEYVDEFKEEIATLKAALNDAADLFQEMSKCAFRPNDVYTLLSFEKAAELRRIAAGGGR